MTNQALILTSLSQSTIFKPNAQITTSIINYAISLQQQIKSRRRTAKQFILRFSFGKPAKPSLPAHCRTHSMVLDEALTAGSRHRRRRGRLGRTRDE
uniref:Uncharacterized protein n=1 Tax=Kalanchoe fedtschenkoi TaxID=63787 RepID=A0A7N0VG88_KALFE